MFVAVAVLLKVTYPYQIPLFRLSDGSQATKGVSGLYDAIEHLYQKIADYLDRVSLYLQPPSSPPNSALMSILVQTCVQVLNVLAMTTKYCRSSADIGLKVFYRRSSGLPVHHIILSS